MVALPMAAFAATLVQGVYALPEGEPKVSATLAATPGTGSHVTLDITMTALDQQQPIKQYDTELSKQLHVIAISSDFRTFVHEHGEQPGLDGHFHVAMPLSHPGLYHIYVDGVPTGLGQQVMRFELPVGMVSASAPPAALKPSGFESTEAGYSVRFEPFALHAGQESQLTLHVSRGGKPVSDLTPFLGVAAHAVFIDVADLTYVHVHAAPAEASASDCSGVLMKHGLMGKTPADPPPAGHADGMAGMDSMDGMGAPLPAGSHLPADMTLHILAPKPGTYLLWLQFMAGGQVRTVPFTVAVT
jgi:hypothetical protein